MLEIQSDQAGGDFILCVRFHFCIIPVCAVSFLYHLCVCSFIPVSFLCQGDFILCVQFHFCIIPVCVVSFLYHFSVRVISFCVQFHFCIIPVCAVSFLYHYLSGQFHFICVVSFLYHSCLCGFIPVSFLCQGNFISSVWFHFCIIPVYAVSVRGHWRRWTSRRVE